MAVFEHLSTTSGATLSELAADTDQSPATTYRILVTLEARDLVEFDPAPQLWHIGPARVPDRGALPAPHVAGGARPPGSATPDGADGRDRQSRHRAGGPCPVRQPGGNPRLDPRLLSARHAVAHARLGDRQGASGADVARAARASPGGQGGVGAVHGPHADRSGGDRGRHGPDPAARLCHRRRGEDRRHALHRGAGPRSAWGGGGRAFPSRVRRAV
jgi:hypothetical protein